MRRSPKLNLWIFAALGGVAAFLWLTPKGRAIAQSAGDRVAEVAMTVRDEVLGWIGTAEAKANYLRYADAIERASISAGLPPKLLERIAWIESRFRSDVINGSLISSAGAVGMFQIVPRWHPTIALDAIKDPNKAAPYAAAFLRRLYNKFGAWDKAVAAYNTGEGNVAKAIAKAQADGTDWATKLPAETQKYVALARDKVALA